MVPGGSERLVKHITPQNWGRLAVSAVVAVSAVYLVFRLYKIFLLFYLALLFGLAINAFILWLERHRVSRTLAVAGLALIFITGIVAVGYLIVPPATAQAQTLYESYPEYYTRVQDWFNGIMHRYPELQKSFDTGAPDLSTITPRATSFVRQLGTFAMSIGGLLFSGFLLFFLIVYGLMNPQPMARALFDLTPATLHDRLERTLRGIQEKVVAWAGGTFILMAVIGVAVYVGLLLIGVPQALLFGILAAIGEGIPTLGPILSAIPPIFVMLLNDPVKAGLVLGLFILVQQLENNLLVPMIMGNRLNVHPWALIFMMLVMGEMFGIVGVFLATPTTAILGVIYQEMIPKPGLQDPVPATQRVGRVIGGVQEEASEAITTDPPSPAEPSPTS